MTDTTPAAAPSEPEITEPSGWMGAATTSALELPIVPEPVRAGLARVFADLVDCHEQLRRTVAAAQELGVDIDRVLADYRRQHHPVPLDVDNAVCSAVFVSSGIYAIFDVALSISALAGNYHGCASDGRPLADPAVLWPAAAHPLPDRPQSAA